MKNWSFKLAVVALFYILSMAVNSNSVEANDEKSVPQLIKELQTSVSSLEKTISSQQNEISSLKQTISNQQQEIDQLKLINTHQNDDIMLINKTLAEQQEELIKTYLLFKQMNRDLEDRLDVFIKETRREINNIWNTLSNLPGNGVTEHSIRGYISDINGNSFYSPLVLTSTDGKLFNSNFENDGQFSFSNIPDGTYTLKFDSTQYQNVNTYNDQIIEVKNSNIEGVSVKISVQTYTVYGKALRADGSPIENKSISIKDFSGVTWKPIYPHTQPDGSFKIGGLPKGTYKIEIGDPGNNSFIYAYVVIKDSDVKDLVIQEEPIIQDPKKKL